MLQRRKFLFAILALAPTLAIYAWVRVYPIGDVLRLSLYQWNLLSRNKPFIGLENFRALLDDQLFLDAITNTSIIAFGILAITIPLGMGLAMLIHARAASRLSGFYETAIFLPHVASLVPAAMAWKWIFDARLGPLNALLGWFGVQPKAWLFDPVLAVVCIIVLGAWQALGYAVLIFLVGIKNLPTAPYEAAKIDGASPWQSFRYISIPLLKPITLYVSVVTLVAGFNVYAQAFVLASDSQGAPGRLVRVLVLDMMENSFRNYRFGYAAAEAVVLLLVVLSLTAIQFGLLRERGGRA
ncbi:sugar ABC transporter permease [Terrarubrum flagellatum]|uniref:carbohydrate ABC transporter permease n=1 Tax=Terrirubrum flagellatum TaxID=2895980 RepID=UPI0031455DBE